MHYVQCNNIEHVCRACGCELVVGKNWTHSKRRYSDYICRECSLAYNTHYSYMHGIKPMSQNKECASYLGCFVAESVLAQVFKDVTKMPMHNPGFDFICNRGKKIDVKSSCIREVKCNTDTWIFTINKNKIPDYFLCIAFDNRDDLNPLHLWLIPGDIVGDLWNASISVTTLNKWDDYRLNIDNVVSCCDTMKSGLND